MAESANGEQVQGKLVSQVSEPQKRLAAPVSQRAGAGLLRQKVAGVFTDNAELREKLGALPGDLG
eukprot:15438292-Alexandrium_andersonii.AAC.1